MTFLVNLIKSAPTEFLKDNATHVTGHYWLYEGMLECLGGGFLNLGEAAVPSLGGLSESELIGLANDYFNYDTGNHVSVEDVSTDEQIKKLTKELADLLGKKGETFFFANISSDEINTHSNIPEDRLVEFLLELSKSLLADKYD